MGILLPDIVCHLPARVKSLRVLLARSFAVGMSSCYAVLKKICEKKKKISTLMNAFNQGSVEILLGQRNESGSPCPAHLVLPGVRIAAQRQDLVHPP